MQTNFGRLKKRLPPLKHNLALPTWVNKVMNDSLGDMAIWNFRFTNETPCKLKFVRCANLLSYFFDKKFVKMTFSPKNELKIWFHKILFVVRKLCGNEK